jgi:hypothetical protein
VLDLAYGLEGGRDRGELAMILGGVAWWRSTSTVVLDENGVYLNRRSRSPAEHRP